MTTAPHDPARFFALLTGSQEERDAAPAIEHDDLPDHALVLLDRFDAPVVSVQVYRDEYQGAFRAVAALDDLRTLLEERERMRKALSDIATTAELDEDYPGMRSILRTAGAALNPKAQELGT